MKVPEYTKRSRAELQKALEWAQRELHFQSWTVTLFVGDEAEDDASLRGQKHARASFSVAIDEMDALIAVRPKVCERMNTDPLFSLFHEMGHLALWLRYIVDPNAEKQNDLWEQACTRFASLLHPLYLREGP